MFTVRLKTHDTPAGIQQKIASAIGKEMRAAFKAAASDIQKDIRLVIFDRIYKCDAYQSLLDGELQGDMGLRDPDAVLTPILRQWIDTLIFSPISITAKGGHVSGGFTISFIDATWDDVLSMQESHYISYNRRNGTAIEIPWLRWLLEAGAEILVRDWTISFDLVDVSRGHSRSQKAIMVETPAGYWQVPANFQGTRDNNFVTRALEGIDEEIRVVIQTEVYKRIK